MMTFVRSARRSAANCIENIVRKVMSEQQCTLGFEERAYTEEEIVVPEDCALLKQHWPKTETPPEHRCVRN